MVKYSWKNYESLVPSPYGQKRLRSLLAGSILAPLQVGWWKVMTLPLSVDFWWTPGCK
jgi:hypothetical protein